MEMTLMPAVSSTPRRWSHCLLQMPLSALSVHVARLWSEEQSFSLHWKSLSAAGHPVQTRLHGLHVELRAFLCSSGKTWWESPPPPYLRDGVGAFRITKRGQGGFLLMFSGLQDSSSGEGLHELLREERSLWTLQVLRPAHLSWTSECLLKARVYGMSRTSLHTRPCQAIYKRDFLTEISTMWAQQCCSS